jgi:hypothetical protein
MTTGVCWLCSRFYATRRDPPDEGFHLRGVRPTVGEGRLALGAK